MAAGGETVPGDGALRVKITKLPKMPGAPNGYRMELATKLWRRAADLRAEGDNRGALELESEARHLEQTLNED